MLRYAVKKFLYGVAVMAGVIVVVFVLFNILPGDPARMTMGQRSDVSSLEAVRKEFGLDKSKPVQFFLYLNDLSPIGLHENTPEAKEKYHYVKLIGFGDEVLALKWPYLRRSYQTKRDVTTILSETVPNTFILALTAMIFATLVGVFLGVLSAVHKDTWIDKAANSFAILGISAPSFFAGIIIAWLFGFVLSNYTGLNMSGSLYSYDPFKGEVMTWKNLWLPMLTLGLRPLAIIVQLTRSAMLDVLAQDYIRTARAKGLSRNAIIYKHALKNALNPVITAISGWFASLLAGSFFVEYIFGYNGLGRTTVNALEMSDFPVVMGSILFIALVFVIINILVDVLYAFVDPRVKLA
ncbi:ABC transporter permease [Pedobacter heparinus]|uniref:Binding-protein-dependent transport systems inner membrane component n=1 Tax=Pedobacter heparinus (strain ATCC 13125 / DSM 2366 / CIP 104194 / JCM 7457 / NBRC 12017 / NCIMB 9290 / NRRL B-14731 / HIM 762-3) TaxID=485917 RepID=C6XU58_PEDHD|nr:ABC transporter permease [Pedobacter heparinus]ACU05851.1 binding-protein-dependent transport systems inner membrane component [Pedobacter heparinus DSM 2366]